MTINYNVTGTERKRLAEYISGFMGTEKKYLGAPTFAYQIGYLTVSKDGAVSFEDQGYNSDIDALMTELEGQGFHTEDTIVKPNTAEQEAVPATDENLDKEWPAEAGNGPQRPNMGLTVAIPLDKVQIDNLDRILAAKGSLIKKALGIDALPVEVGENTLSFPWLSELPGPDAAKAYTHLISALCKMSVLREGTKMTITEAMSTYRLPNTTTPEDLECRWNKLLTFGNKVVIAGYFFNGRNKPCYFGVVYEFLTDDHTCEGAIELKAASEVEFEDDGHAIAWAMAH